MEERQEKREELTLVLQNIQRFRMNKITTLQEEFFKALRSVQGEAVGFTLCGYKEGNDIEDVFYDITSDLICGMMVLVDGYTRDHIQLDIIDRETKESIRDEIELHDSCVDYLTFEKPKET